MQDRFKSGSVAVLLVVLIASAAVLGAITFYKGTSWGNVDSAKFQPGASSQKVATSSASTLSKSDTVTAIDKDLSETDFSQVDNELKSFDAAFK